MLPKITGSFKITEMALLGYFNQEKALVGAFSAIMNLRIDLFQALVRI